LEFLEELSINVMIPAVCVVETASVIARLTGNRELAKLASEKLRDIYHVVREDQLLDQAWEIALTTGASGFDSYFIAAAKVFDALLMTDDVSMADKAARLGVNVILVREADIEEIRSTLQDA